jgi:hypothetical protein
MIYKKHFKQFVKELDKKMLKGFKEYGDVSFNRKSEDLVGEIEQELLDICGWSLILWVHLNELKLKVKKHERKRKNTRS